MGDKIIRPNFLKVGEFTFSFSMTDHLTSTVPEVKSLTAICKKIYSYHQLEFPNWTRLRADFRIIRITPDSSLFQYLDTQSKRKGLNWLIFSRIDDKILVTHFGPFGRKKEDDFEDKVDRTRRSLMKLKDIWKQVRSSSVPQKEKESQLNAIHTKILNEFWQLVKAVEEKVEAKKKELKKAAEEAFCDEEEVKKLVVKKIEQITIKAGWVIAREIILLITREIAKEIAKVMAKQTAKQGTKSASKEAAKTTAKSIPLVGLGVGAGFAVWRWAKGDVTGAGLELASGAASCIPGAGTAASVAIDAGILAKDIIELVEKKKKQMERLKEITERIEKELKKLFEEYEKAKEEYEFVREVLGDPGYDYRKLQHDIEVVEDVLDEIRAN